MSCSPPLPEEVVRIELPTPFPVGPVNTYLVLRDEPILVDAGPNTKEAYDALARGLGDAGCAIADIRHILITHGHLDHMGLLGRLIEESGAEVYAHPVAVKRSREYDEDSQSARAFYAAVMAEAGVPANVIDTVTAESASYRHYGAQAVIGHDVDDGEEVLGYHAYHAPGHSPSDVLFVNAAGGYAFTGDHILERMSPNPLIRRPPPGRPRPKSLVELQQSLKRTRELELGWCFPGHGEPFRDYRGIVDSLLERHEQRSAKVLSYLREAPLSAYEVAQRLFPGLAPQHLYLGLSVAMGHLELLETNGLAVVEHRDGVAVYRPVDEEYSKEVEV